MNHIDLSLYLVTDNSDDVEKFLNTIEEGIKGGVTVVQIREKTADTLDFYNLALQVKEITKKYDIPLIINDRVDVALVVEADGVVLEKDEMSVEDVRGILKENSLVGFYAKNVEQALDATNFDYDYIFFDNEKNYQKFKKLVDFKCFYQE